MLCWPVLLCWRSWQAEVGCGCQRAVFSERGLSHITGSEENIKQRRQIKRLKEEGRMREAGRELSEFVEETSHGDVRSCRLNIDRSHRPSNIPLIRQKSFIFNSPLKCNYCLFLKTLERGGWFLSLASHCEIKSLKKGYKLNFKKCTIQKILYTSFQRRVHFLHTWMCIASLLTLDLSHWSQFDRPPPVSSRPFSVIGWVCTGLPIPEVTDFYLIYFIHLLWLWLDCSDSEDFKKFCRDGISIESHLTPFVWWSGYFATRCLGICRLIGCCQCFSCHPLWMPTDDGLPVTAHPSRVLTFTICCGPFCIGIH